MSTTAQTTTPTTDILSPLASLRNLIRLYVFAQGVAVCVSVVAVGFWLSLAVDWIFEPSPRVRGLVLVLLGLMLLYAIYHWLLRRLLVPLTDRSMAALLERRYRQLDDRLLTVVELSPRQPEISGFDPGMLRNTRDEVLELLPQADIAPVMNFRPLAKAVGLAVLLVVSVVAFMSWQTSAATTWFDRSVLLGDSQWPRATRLVVEGFPVRDGRRMVMVAKGSSLTVKAKADTMLAIPDALQIRYQTAEGSTGRPNMTMLKRAVPGRDEYQDFEYVFKNVQTDIVFDVVAIHGGIFGKNDRVRNLVIGAVDSPDLVDVVLQCKYPEYVNRPDEKFSVRLVQPLPEGTQVTIVGRANKDLVAAEYQVLTDDPEPRQQTIQLVPDDPRTVHVPLGPLAADTRVAFQLHDTDGVSNQQPIQTLIRIVADQPPQVEVNLVGIGKAVTPMAVLPMRGTIWDDHGLSRTWFEYQVDGKEPELREFDIPAGGPADDQQQFLFEVEDVVAAPGQRLSLLVKAADNYGLARQPQVGTSQRYELQVVTEAQLRAILETRERILRRRFEGIIDEMNRMRDSLSRLIGQDPPDRSAGDNDRTDETDRADADAGAAETETLRLSSRRILRAEQALQTSDRMRHETQEVADEFGRILLELENNNVSYFDELQKRLGDGIIAPLTEIAGKQFPLLDDRLGHLRQVLDDEVARDTAGVAARRQIDILLRQMDEVLRNMLELQKFNELLADLRKIIDAHKQVSQLTEKERERLKKRLKDELKKDLLE